MKIIVNKFTLFFSEPAVSLLPVLMVILIAGSTWHHDVHAQDSDQHIVLSLEEAIQIALVQNLALSNVRLDGENVRSLVMEGWAELFPQVDINSSFTRNIRSANPFAGSDAGSLFETLGFIDWLAFNEQARTDSDVGSIPIPIDEYFFRLQQGYNEAGIVINKSDNPFDVPNVSVTGISISQKLFDGRVIFGARGASRWLKPFTDNAISREEQKLIDQTRTAWYSSLLLEEQEKVLVQSVERARRTQVEISRQVAQGMAPKFQRLSAEVEVANLESQLVQATTATARSIDNLKLLLSIPASYSMELRDHLESNLDDTFMGASSKEAMRSALQQRPDLEQARIGIELDKVQLRVARADYLPNLDAFANFNWLGNIPDNRTSIISSPDDDFSFSSTQRKYFDTAYWDRSVSVGLRFSWNVFNGFASRQRIQQRKIAVKQAENDAEFLSLAIQVEVEQAIRDVRAAHSRMGSQRKNVGLAELNFDFAEARLAEGVATPLEVREASNQLDQSRLGYLQAVHDFLVAKSAFETAIGNPIYNNNDQGL